MISRRFTAWLSVPLALGLTALSSTGCIDRPVHQVLSQSQSVITLEVANDTVTKLDLLLEVDNSNSMRVNQQHIMEQLGALITTLTSPPCTSSANPSPHQCDPANPDDRFTHPAVSDLHVAVIDSDLGTGGVRSQACIEAALGDDGAMNPIRNGLAMAHHQPGTSAPPGFRPASCPADTAAFPSFLAYDSHATDASAFADAFRCNAGLYVGGCGLEQQLESVYRALVVHDPHVRTGNTDVNAGFLREDALLAIVLLTDEDDGSVRDCRFANGMPCDDATSVFDTNSTAWGGGSDLNMRMYDYQPGSVQDPTWTLDRYIDPRDATHGWLALKPGHPERIVFAAITGVPLGTSATGGDTDWDALLGRPGPVDPNDFASRNTSTAIDTSTPEGPVSMRQANVDTTCPSTAVWRRTVPACRREGTTATPGTCDPAAQYYAWPARRIVEIARRFDQAPLCGGQPCHNGVVTSICANDYTAAMRTILAKIQNRLPVPCLVRPLQTHATATGARAVDCRLREVQPVGVQSCDASRGRVQPLDTAASVTLDGESRIVCDIEQASADQATSQPTPGEIGWYYDTSAVVRAGASRCDQRISFTEGAAPAPGTVTRLECVQSIHADNGTPVGP